MVIKGLMNDLHSHPLNQSLILCMDNGQQNSPVNEQVCRKSTAPLETFSTLFALKNLLRAVDCPAIVTKMMMNILRL